MDLKKMLKRWFTREAQPARSPERIQYTLYAPSLFKGGTGLKASSEAERTTKIKNAFGDHEVFCFVTGSQEEAEYKMNQLLGIRNET